MRFLFFLILILLLVILQTAIIPYLPAIIQLYDLIIPFVVYLSLYRPLSEGLPSLLLAGLATDILSGAPFGIYLTTYFWIFVLFRQVPRWVGIREHVLFAWMVILGVLFENALFCVSVFIASDVNPAATQVFRFAIFQTIWAVITGPLLWVCFQYLFVFAEGVFGKSAANGQ